MNASTALTDPELMQQFVSTTLPTDAFTHQQHVRVAWLFVQRFGMPGAIDEFAVALRRYADAKGAHRLFHATITWAYLLLIYERQQRCGAAEWLAFAAANADLLTWKPSILDRYYTEDVLWSEHARRTFVMPNRGLAT